uniref:Integrase_H2C2 domain-containing protein n=1 Tax=Anopheles dirus TaxID=7168 RepID=A0A182ND73_9DIPT
NRSGVINVRLPKIELPTFDGDSTKWLTFRDRFVAMIDSSADIPSILKLQYLLSSLKGDAGMLFEHTSLTADNYEVTWAALLKRYDNPRTLIREYYRKIHHLPSVTSDNVNDLAQLVDEFMRHVNGLKKLNEPVESWDTPLTNLLLMKLHHSSILAWENHSANHKRDKYQELMDFLQDRIRILRSTQTFSQTISEGSSRMVAGNKQGIEAPKRVIGNTASTQKIVQHNSTPIVPTHLRSSCSLGCAEAHNFRTCPEFAKMDVQQRREIAAKERLCFNCLNRYHHVKDSVELQNAELRLCQLAQQESFPDEFHELKLGKQVSADSKLKWLSPYLDQLDTLRVGGRLGNARLSENAKHPIVLAASHPLSTLLAVAYHQQLLHAGPQLLLATLRQRFWLIGGRNLTRKVFHHCLVCYRNKPILVKQSVADLPTSRVTPSAPFAISGVDYCGPFLLKSPIRNRAPTKAYIAIFVCFATRAVHIELVSDLTTTSFLAALRRFVSRRG